MKRLRWHLGRRRRSRRLRARVAWYTKQAAAGAAVGAVLVALVLLLPGTAAAAAPPTWSNTCLAGDVNENLCQVESERLQYVADELAAIDARQVDDSHRLDLMWWGAWFACGLIVARLVQPYWDRLYNWNRLPA